MSDSKSQLYRVDKFVVPDGAKGEFLALVERAHDILRAQNGFIEDQVLAQVAGPSRFNVTTIAAWASRESYDAAVAAVTSFHASIGFDRKAVMSRLGIEADVGVYRTLEVG